MPEVVDLAPETEITQVSEREPALASELEPAPAPVPEVAPTPANDDLPDWLKNFAPVTSESSASKPTSTMEEDVF